VKTKSTSEKNIKYLANKSDHSLGIAPWREVDPYSVDSTGDFFFKMVRLELQYGSIILIVHALGILAI